MEFRKLEYFDSVYRLRSFTKAARENFVSQPSLSNAIRSLEEELHCTLINRNTQPLSFTPEGERFIFHVQRILNDARVAKLEMASASAAEEITLRLSWPSCFIHDYLLPRLYTDFHDLYPNYQLVCIESTIEETIRLLLDSRLDVAYVHVPDSYDTNQLEFIPIICCEMCALISKNNPLASMETLSISQLAKEHIFSFQKGSLYRRKLDEAFECRHIVPNITSINQMRIIQRLVSEDRGISFVTIDDSENLDAIGNLALVPLAEPISFVKGFLMKKGDALLPPIQNLITYVQSVIQQMRFPSSGTEEQEK